MSAADLIAVLITRYLQYDWAKPKDPHHYHWNNSKGHASPLGYAMFKPVGATTDAELMTFRRFGSRLQGHPTPVIPWVDVATGSLGQGLPIGVGVALAGQYLDKLPYHVWVLCGDSELAEGSIWEAIDKAAHYQLANLSAIWDINRLGQRGETEYGWSLDTYRRRVEAFGCHPIVIDGHDLASIDRAFGESRSNTGKPTVIIAKTVKGKGFSEIENKDGWHGRALPPDMAERAFKELGGIRNLKVKTQKPERSAAPKKPAAAVEPVMPTYKKEDKVATRKAYGDGDRPGRTVADGARGPRVHARDPQLDGAVPVRPQPDGQADQDHGRHARHRLHADDARRLPDAVRPQRFVQGRRLEGAAPERERQGDAHRRRCDAAQLPGRRGRAGGEEDSGSRDRPLLGQAGRRQDAARSGQGDQRTAGPGRGPLPGGRPGRRCPGGAGRGSACAARAPCGERAADLGQARGADECRRDLQQADRGRSHEAGGIQVMATASQTKPNPIKELRQIGQSLWLDNIRRQLVTSGELARLRDEGLTGVTSNPTIFEKAVSGSTDYDEAMVELVRQKKKPEEMLWDLMIEDVQSAADVFRPVYDKTKGKDGFVSIEVGPTIAHSSRETIKFAQYLHDRCRRPNVMVKIPATEAGLPAIENQISKGNNINITLIFAVERYDEVVEAYLSGLEKLHKDGGDLSKVASVASFFVSRVDTKVDKQLTEKSNTDSDPKQRETLERLYGKAAIANSKMAYEHYKQHFPGPRWAQLRQAGARTQRCLWASTSTK